MAKPRKLALGPPRSEKDESEVRWLISYSDFMMQLVCLFILLYSVSFFDKGRMARVAGAYRASVGIGDLAALDTRSRGDRLAIGDRPLFGGELGGSDVPRGVRFRVEVLPGGRRLAFDQAVFEAGAATFTEAGARAVDDAARTLRAYPGRATIAAAGDDAAEADPLRLALSRAEAVAARLAAGGVDPRFVTISGEARRAGGDSRNIRIDLQTD